MFSGRTSACSRHLAKRFFVERGNLKVAWDAGVNAVPVKVAIAHRIPLVFYAEHGESEYGGRVLSEESTKIRDLTEVIEHQIGDDPRNWTDDELSTSATLDPYVYPDAGGARGGEVKAMYFAYFFRWSMLENYRFLREKIAFRPASGRAHFRYVHRLRQPRRQDRRALLLPPVREVRLRTGRPRRLPDGAERPNDT